MSLRVLALLGLFGLCLPAQDHFHRAGFALAGDMLLPYEVVHGDATFSGTPWTNGQVPYAFHSSVDAWEQRLMRLAFAEWAAVCDVDFFLRTNESNYISVRVASSNTSFVGMVGGPQSLRLNNWNRRGTPYHEVGHALTFLHEQQRPDRDNYIAVQWQNITQSFWSAYQIQTSATTFGPYDFGSCMHYPDWGFSSNGLPTMLALPQYAPQQALMGQRDRVTFSDATGAASVYGAPSAPTVTSVAPTLYAGSATQWIEVRGDRFFTGSVVTWNGTPIPTRYAEPGLVLARVDTALMAIAATAQVAVDNPSPGGGSSAPLATQVTSAMPPSPPTALAAAIPLGWGCRGMPNGPRLLSSAPPVLGSTLTLSVAECTASANGFLFVSPPAAALINLSYDGCEIQVDPLTMQSLLGPTTTAAGTWSQSIPLGNTPAAAGLEYDLQAAFPDPGSEIGFCLTNGLRMRLGL